MEKLSKLLLNIFSGTSNDLSAFTELMREKYPDFYAKKAIVQKKTTDGFDTIFSDK